jgi:hypothetical protein
MSSWARWIYPAIYGAQAFRSGGRLGPTFELHGGSGTLIDSNDNWELRPDGSSQQAELEATGLAPTDDLNRL